MSKTVLIEEHIFRDNLVGWYNMSRKKFASVMYDYCVSSGMLDEFIDSKYERFKENPLAHVLTLDSANFRRFMDFILDAREWE